jgi:hypothetical protein
MAKVNVQILIVLACSAGGTLCGSILHWIRAHHGSQDFLTLGGHKTPFVAQDIAIDVFLGHVGGCRKVEQQLFRYKPIVNGNFPADVFEKPEKDLAFALSTSATASVKTTTLQLHHTPPLPTAVCVSLP